MKETRNKGAPNTVSELTKKLVKLSLERKAQRICSFLQLHEETPTTIFHELSLWVSENATLFEKISEASISKKDIGKLLNLFLESFHNSKNPKLVSIILYCLQSCPRLETSAQETVLKVYMDLISSADSLDAKVLLMLHLAFKSTNCKEEIIDYGLKCCSGAATMKIVVDRIYALNFQMLGGIKDERWEMLLHLRITNFAMESASSSSANDVRIEENLAAQQIEYLAEHPQRFVLRTYMDVQMLKLILHSFDQLPKSIKNFLYGKISHWFPLRNIMKQHALQWSAAEVILYIKAIAGIFAAKQTGSIESYATIQHKLSKSLALLESEKTESLLEVKEKCCTFEGLISALTRAYSKTPFTRALMENLTQAEFLHLEAHAIQSAVDEGGFDAFKISMLPKFISVTNDGIVIDYLHRMYSPIRTASTSSQRSQVFNIQAHHKQPKTTLLQSFLQQMSGFLPTTIRFFRELLRATGSLLEPYNREETVLKYFFTATACTFIEVMDSQKLWDTTEKQLFECFSQALLTRCFGGSQFAGKIPVNFTRLYFDLVGSWNTGLLESPSSSTYKDIKIILGR